MGGSRRKGQCVGSRKADCQMKACIQRVGWARVRVAGEVVGEVGRGILVLLGVAGSDGDGEAELLAQKTAGLRIFEDNEGKMNLAVGEIGGADPLVVESVHAVGGLPEGTPAEFRRRGSSRAGRAALQGLCRGPAKIGIAIAEGRFREHMEVELLNDGPVTILLDSEELRRPRRGPSKADTGKS